MSKYVGEPIKLIFGDDQEHKFHKVGEKEWEYVWKGGVEYWAMWEVTEVTPTYMESRKLSPFVTLDEAIGNGRAESGGQE